MIDIIQVTAQYSNAVLVAVLPWVADFAAKLQLPGRYSTDSVVEFRCDPRAGYVGGRFTFTNGFDFWFEHGHVSAFRSRHSYYELQNPADIPRFFGKQNLSEAQALSLARQKLQALGYDLATVYADTAPEVTGPPVVRSNIVPHFKFEWLDPLFQVASVSVEVDAERGSIENVQLFTRKTWRLEPKLPAHVLPVIKPTAAWDSSQSNAVTKSMLRLLPEYIRRLSLGLPPPRPENILNVERGGGVWQHILRLKNGYAFTAIGEEITGFIGPKCLFYHPQAADYGRPVNDYIGKWTVSEPDAVAIASAVVRKADPKRTPALFSEKPVVVRSKDAGRYVIPRFIIAWEHGPTKSQAVVEVDACDGTVRYLFVFAALPSEKCP